MLRIGVVGSGFMGRTWAEVSRRHLTGADVVGVTGGRRAAALADDYDVPRYDSVEKLLASGTIDVVVLASPPAGHLEQTLLAARHGVHLLVEKPMANSLDEARQMVDACDKAGVKLAVVSQHRFRDAPVAAKRALDGGELGVVRMARAIGPEVGFWDMTKTMDQWKLDPAQQGVYASWGAHACDLLRWFVGDEPDLAFAMFSNHRGESPVGSNAMVSYRFPEAMSQVWMSYEIPSPGLGSGLQFQLVADRGILEVDAYGDVRLGRDGEWSTIHRHTPFDASDPVSKERLRAYAAELQDLLDAVAEDRPPFVDGVSGAHTVAMLDAAEQSAAAGHAVAVARP